MHGRPIAQKRMGRIAAANRTKAPNLGSAVPFSRLTEDQAREIFSLKGGHEGPTAIGRRFGVDRNTIHHIWARKTWKHIHADYDYQRERPRTQRFIDPADS